MSITQKTFTISMTITIDIDDTLPSDQTDDPFDLAATVCYGFQLLNEDDNLFRGGKVRQYGASVIAVQETNFDFD